MISTLLLILIIQTSTSTPTLTIPVQISECIQLAEIVTSKLQCESDLTKLECGLFTKAKQYEALARCLAAKLEGCNRKLALEAQPVLCPGCPGCGAITLSVVDSALAGLACVGVSAALGCSLCH